MVRPVPSSRCASHGPGASALSTRWPSQLSRTVQLKPIGGAAVGYSGHAADGAQFIGVNLEIVDDLLGKVKSQHLSEDQTAAVGLFAYGHYQHQPTFHLHAAFGYTVRLNQVAGDGG
jgi:hypothetical protein